MKPSPHRICPLEDIEPGSGVAALAAGRQVAIFRVEDAVYALGNLDPFSKANVLSRGIVGDLKGEPVVASPVYKQHFRLADGRCVEEPAVSVPAYPARVEEGYVVVDVSPAEVATTCCYCGVGCGVLASASGEKITAVRGDPAHPANFGRLCSKGMSLHRADPAFRGLYPEIHGERVTWDAALDFAAAGFRRIIDAHGPDAVAFYISGQLLTEDYYVFNKLAKGLIGTNNIDTNSRLCMASAVAGYKQTLGADAPPACYEDLDHAECVFIAGSNAAWAHPVLYRRLEAAKPKHVIVVDPRRTETARAATRHLQIAPGTDVALFSGMLHVMQREGWIDREYVERCTERFSSLSLLPAEEAARVCGIPAGEIVEAARLFACSKGTLSLYCQGLNQSASGTAKNAALINLHLATGQIGRPGAGPLSLTGQPNAMGGREVGGMANLLSAHRDLASAAHRTEVAALWGVPSVPSRPGRTAVELFEALRSGEIKAVWIACTNPAHSLPDQAKVREALQRAELVVVQDAYRNTETAAFAHVFLPAAAWGEKEGTMTNSERRISRVRQVVPAPGEAREDWRIAVDLAKRMGGEKLLPYETAEAVFNEHRESTRGRDLDITGLSYALLDERGPQQWPFPEGAGEGRRRLYEDGVFPTPSGRARFVPTPYRPVAEEVDAVYPLRLTTGRLRDQWHTMSRTGTIARLFAHEPEPRVLLSPQDLFGLNLEEGELVRVASPRGEAYFQVSGDPDLPKGSAFIAMHWGQRFLGRGVNELTLGALDPVSKQPELKHCAVRVEPAKLPWRFVASGYPKDVAGLFNALDFAMRAAPYAARTLIGRDRAGVRLALASSVPVDIERIRALFAEYAGGTVSYEDSARGRVLCNCHDVAEADVVAFLKTSKSLEALQASLKCGTSCGSCLPEVRRQLAA